MALFDSSKKKKKLLHLKYVNFLTLLFKIDVHQIEYKLSIMIIINIIPP